MSYFLDDEQKLVREAARKFAQGVVEPRAISVDAGEDVPGDLVAKCAELGFFGLYTPEAYGGSEAGMTMSCVVLEEIAKASTSFAGLLSVQIVLCPMMVDVLGSPAQKERLLRPSAAGESLMAVSQTEPAGATNVMAHQTRITPDGAGFRLNGLKLFCTQGTATNYLIWARFSQNGQEGYAPVIVEKGAPGFDIMPYEDKLGWRGTGTGTISFTDVWIRPEDVLGDRFLAAMTLGQKVFSPGALGHAATSLGCVEGLLDKTSAYVKDRHLYGQPMAALQPVTYWLSDSWAKIEACRAMLYSATALWDEGRPNFSLIAACKAHICELALECSNRLMQLWGGHGIMHATGINRYMRDARTNTIAEGASEMYLSEIAAREFDLGPFAGMRGGA